RHELSRHRVADHSRHLPRRRLRAHDAADLRPGAVRVARDGDIASGNPPQVVERLRVDVGGRPHDGHLGVAPPHPAHLDDPVGDDDVRRPLPEDLLLRRAAAGHARPVRCRVGLPVNRMEPTNSPNPYEAPVDSYAPPTPDLDVTPPYLQTASLTNAREGRYDFRIGEVMVEAWQRI